MTSNKPVDFAIKSVSRKDGLTVKIKNKTGLKAPAQVYLYQDNKNDSLSVWTEPFTGSTTVNFPMTDDYRQVKLPRLFPIIISVTMITIPAGP